MDLGPGFGNYVAGAEALSSLSEKRLPGPLGGSTN